MWESFVIDGYPLKNGFNLVAVMVMVPTLEMSGKLETIVEISPTVMENGKSVELPEEKMMICASNCEDNTFDDTAIVLPVEKQVMTCANNCEDTTLQMEASPDICNRIMPSKDCNEDVEVDIVEDTKPNEERVAEREFENGDVTESSSSFGYTDSGIGSAAVSSDIEVESKPQDVHASLLRFDGFRTRKKKLTDHWRKFMRPLMWRCKWVELQLRELHSQVSKYDRELEERDRKKKSGLEKCAAEDVGVKVAPFICQNRSVKLMKRKKRKRVEDTVDLASYTSGHSLFSYFARKRSFADSAYIDNDHDVDPAKGTPSGSDEFGLPGGCPLFEFKDNDAMESILRKIDEAQLHVHQLRIRADKVVREYAGKFSSDGCSFFPDDPSASCAPNLVLSSVNTEKVPLTSQHGQVTPPPDMVETTDQVRSEGRCEMIGNDVLTYDQPVKEELDNTKEVGIHRAESPPLATEGKAGNAEIAPNPNSASQMSVVRQQSTMKTRSISKLISPKNKRKRGRRKARSSRWSRRSSG